MVRDSEIVTSTGAVYQDAKGTDNYPRAHRFPCNPMFGYQNLPDLASWSSLALRNELKVPLAITDPLPGIVNYSDRLFEARAAEHVERAVRWILIEQPKNKDVHQNLIRPECSDWLRFIRFRHGDAMSTENKNVQGEEPNEERR